MILRPAAGVHRKFCQKCFFFVQPGEKRPSGCFRGEGQFRGLLFELPLEGFAFDDEFQLAATGAGFGKGGRSRRPQFGLDFVIVDGLTKSTLNYQEILVSGTTCALSAMNGFVR